MKEEVTHKGKIVSITPETTTVEIISESACASCHAKPLCSLGESTAKMVEVPTSGWSTHEVGDEVEVALAASMGHKAVWVGYCIPLIILVVVLLGCFALRASELVCGLCAIGAVALYYLGIALFGGALRNEYHFTIK